MEELLKRRRDMTERLIGMKGTTPEIKVVEEEEPPRGKSPSRSLRRRRRIKEVQVCYGLIYKR